MLTEANIQNYFNMNIKELNNYLQSLPEEIISDAEHITREDMAKVAEVSELYVYAQSMTSLQGIEYFESLTTLICTMNQLTSLDLSKNTKLMGLNCDINPLKSLDLSQNTALTQLSCNNNQLESLDLSPNTALTMLYCNSNLLTSMDISKNTALNIFICHDNPGDGSTFRVTTWDDLDIPMLFTKDDWVFNGQTISILYQNATGE